MAIVPFAKPYFDMHSIDAYLSDVRHLLMADDGSRISNGENCRKVEEQVAKVSKADHAIATSSCTNAIIIGLGAGGAKGDCYTQSFTWISTSVAAGVGGVAEKAPDKVSQHMQHDMCYLPYITYREIDYERWCALSYKVPMRGTRSYAIAVDTFGMQFHPESTVPIFFDRAHSLGVRFSNLGVMSFLSFSPSKLVTGGEGGMVLTNLERYVKPVTRARDVMCRMNEEEALKILYGLRVLPELLGWKKECYDEYKKAFPDCQFQEGKGNHQVIGMLMPSHEMRDKVVEALKETIEFKTYYEPLHLMSKGSPPLTVTEDVFNRILCLPSWYGLNRRFVVESIKGVIEA